MAIEEVEQQGVLNSLLDTSALAKHVEGAGLRKRTRFSGHNDSVTIENRNGKEFIQRESSSLSDHTDRSSSSDRRSLHIITSIVLTIVALYSRLRLLNRPDMVTWDEAHFGKFAGFYLRRQFYFDVHPPAAKMLIALGGWLSGYRGYSNSSIYTFPSGQTYPDDVNYVGMRLFCGFFGALIVPFMYWAAVQLDMSWHASVLVAACVLLDMSLIAISRQILLDPFLLVFTSLTILGYVGFRNRKTTSRPFSRRWWGWILLTGFGLGMTSSVKWTGLFCIVLVGLFTIHELWMMMGQPRQVGLWQFMAHIVARGVCLLGVPLVVYLFWFHMHFLVLSNSGDGVMFMTSSFQASFKGYPFGPSTEDPIVYGSLITLRNNGPEAALLHSHPNRYPGGSQQQQVTGYLFNDHNSNWILKRFCSASDKPDSQSESGSEKDTADQADIWKRDQGRPLRNGDIIRLGHKFTGTFLHSHPHPAPVTGAGFEVTGYGYWNSTEDFSDPNDNWRVIVAEDDRDGYVLNRKDNNVLPFVTRFRLAHVNLGCYLRTHRVRLPEWGFSQAEVFCDQRRRNDSSSLWNIEYHIHPSLPEDSSDSVPLPKKYHMSLWRRTLELHRNMHRTNSELIPDPNREDTLSSSPTEWPLLYRGLRLNAWLDDHPRVFLLGNPIVWWCGFAALMIYSLVWAMLLVRRQWGIHDLTTYDWQRFAFGGSLCVVGWILHYLPFCMVKRVTYLHHYFPAVLFISLLLGFLLDFFLLSPSQTWGTPGSSTKSSSRDHPPSSKKEQKSSSFTPRQVLHIITIWTFIGIIVGVFLLFRQIPYGANRPIKDDSHLRWRSRWMIT
jgi:dolichyl-phosphate-mannose-protein mannosyltransferase